MTISIKKQRAASGISLLILAAIFGVISQDTPPPRAALQFLEGRLEELVPATTGKSGQPTRFRISGDGRLLQYHSKSGDIGRVQEELKQSAQQTVRVLVDADDKFSTVYEVIVGDRMVRSYENVAAAWRSDNRLAQWIAGISALAGVFVLLRLWWREK